MSHSALGEGVRLEQTERVAISRADRRKEREAIVFAAFGVSAASDALDLVELIELAWHDCYGEITPPDEVIDDLVVLSGGTISGLVRAGRLAVTDWRDLRMAADHIRTRRP